MVMRTATNPNTGEKIQETSPGVWEPMQTGDRATDAPIEWSQVPAMAAQNFVPSAAQLGKDVFNMVRHPVETATSIGNLAVGGVQKLIPGEQEKEKYANAMGQFLSERYGGEDEFKRTLATDPVGFLADLSAFVTGGAGAVRGAAAGVAKAAATGGAVARTATTVGHGAEAVANAAKYLDPIYVAGKIPAAAVSTVPAAALGMLSSTSPSLVREAWEAGTDGAGFGKRGEAFRANMRGAPVEDLVAEARSAANRLREDRSAAYKSGKVNVSNDQTVIDFSLVTDAVDAAEGANTYGTQKVPLSGESAAAINAVRELVQKWSELNPAEYRTPEGLDALKQSVGSLVNWNDRGKAANQAIMSVYSAIGDIITKQAPAYADLMSDYARASREILEIERSLSLGNRAAAESSLIKLLGSTRGSPTSEMRAANVRRLDEVSGGYLAPAIAGQVFSEKKPRGLSQVTGTLNLLGTAGGVINPWALAMLPLHSPRVVGEAVHAAGRVAAPVIEPTRMALELMQQYGGVTPRGLAQGAFQGGRAARVTEDSPANKRMYENMIRALQGAK
jgi:hypothetical protein